jgi:glycine cleavage system H lipoate-binding protein
MTAEARIGEIVQAHEELTGRKTVVNLVRFGGGGWFAELNPSNDRNHHKAIRAEAATFETLIAGLGVAVLALAKKEGRV